MHRFHSEIRQQQLGSLRKRGEGDGIEMAGRSHRRPTGSGDVTRMDERRVKSVPARFGQQISLDGGLVDAIFAERPARLLFGGGHYGARAVHPDRSGVEEVLNLATQRFDQMARAGRGEADHVDDDLAAEAPDRGAETSLLLFHRTIQPHVPRGVPRGVIPVWFPLPAADNGYLMAGLHQAWHEICADMAASPDDDDP